MANLSTHTAYLWSDIFTANGGNVDVDTTGASTFGIHIVDTGATSTSLDPDQATDDQTASIFSGGAYTSSNQNTFLFATFPYDGGTKTGYLLSINGTLYAILEEGSPATFSVPNTDFNTSPSAVSYDVLPSGDETVPASGGPDLGNPDVINAHEGDDSIDGRGGADTIDGGTGEDTIFGGSGADVITGGDDNDSVSGGLNGDTISGDAGNDTLLGGNGNDSISGGIGNDSILGEGNDDTIDGGTGDDTIFGDSAVIIDPDGDVELFGFDRTDVDTTGSSAPGGVGNEQVGDYIIYNSVARTAEGIVVDARLIYVSNTDTDSGTNEIGVDLNNDDTISDPGGPLDGQLDPNLVLINTDEDAAGNAASGLVRFQNNAVQVVIRVEFYEAGTFNHATLTGNVVTLNGTFSFQDLDRTSGTNFEEVRVNTTEFDSYEVTDPADPVGTGLQVTDGGSFFTFAGSQNNTSQDDPDAQVNLGFTNQDDFTVTLRSRVTESGYTFDTQNFSVPTDTVILNGDGADSIDGGDGSDQIYGGAANDTIDGGNDADTIFGDGGDDQLSGGDGADSIEGSTGADTITGGLDGSQDTLGGGNDNDVIRWTANEIIDGGFGNDTFSFLEDTIPGTGNVTITGGEDDDGNDIDVLDFTGSGAGIGGVVYYTDAGLTTLSPGNAPTENGIYTTEDGTVVRFREIESVICFARGTLISTPIGPRPIESLEKGDLIITRDHGLQPIRWIGKRLMPAIGRFAPIRFEPGVLGNTTALEVSPQHRMLVHNSDYRLLHGTNEVLAAAAHLVNGTTVKRRETGMIEYYHILCDQHELVFANGVPSESFHPGEMGLRSINDAARHELFSIFPELAVFGANSYGPSARETLKRFEVAALAG